MSYSWNSNFPIKISIQRSNQTVSLRIVEIFPFTIRSVRGILLSLNSLPLWLFSANKTISHKNYKLETNKDLLVFTTQREGPIISEPQYICDVCGKKKPVSQMAGKCVKCGKYVCSQCAKLRGDKVYCPNCAKCFIATAAYGTPMATEINTLREFRDIEMESNPLGKHLVTLYYIVSPPIAKIITRNESMRAFVRLGLSPVVRSLKSKANQKDF